jgi:hypothetical protein
MPRCLATLLTGGFLCVLMGGAAVGQVLPPVVTVSPPVIQVQPVLKPIPNVPGVVYAPSLGQDLFRYQNNYYYWHEGRWFQGPNYRGPWNIIQSPPPIFNQIGPSYYKRPPGWDRGQKTGWQGAPLPPGQMKKQQPGAAPVVVPYDGGVVVQPADEGGPGKGKKGKGGPPGKMK